ncbi:TIGR03083 family protein [Singulisphaera sp. GP187]|uniref:maleylpyruvate isomerase N-terminal domain-containing protein n=1 Tax=Singulisphaera sp. GP187 TaxID=1882752 RepID=UPI00092C873E|nr:maleylpyruvate isomerase N-terminal domain-containing protein [Singulisphaera sp. GP187]SIO57079.1 TIGR03083 family protein [Singulisphaera sp. GP187]
MKSPAPILVSHLFRELDGHLLDLLRSLAPEDWNRPTVCSAWSVKDISSHLLDSALRRLSIQRDGYIPPHAPEGFDSYTELVAYLNRLNAEWTAATARLSPTVLIGLLEKATAELADLFESTDPLARACFSVAWAGESESLMGFDLAREFTERWHHQRQIADAVDRPTPIDERRFYYPVLDTFMRALPHTYRDVKAPAGTFVSIRVVGDSGGDWFLRREENAWCLIAAVDENQNPDSVVTIDQAIAWKLLTKRTDRATARARFPTLRIDGEPAYGEPVLEMVSIMA